METKSLSREAYNQIKKATVELEELITSGNELGSINLAMWLGERTKYLVNEVERLCELLGPNKALYIVSECISIVEYADGKDNRYDWAHLVKDMKDFVSEVEGGVLCTT